MLAAMIRGCDVHELDEEDEAAGVLLSETLSLVRMYLTDKKVK